MQKICKSCYQNKQCIVSTNDPKLAEVIYCPKYKKEPKK